MKRASFLPSLLVVSALFGCSTKAPPRTPGMEALGIDATTSELRLEVYRFESYFAAAVQTGAEEILTAEIDPNIRMNALRWKINATPAIQSAMFQLDPVAAIADAWGLCLQMEAFFTDGAGRDLFGTSQPVAVEISQRLLAEARALALATVGEARIAEVEPRLATWVQENPLPDLTFGRRAYLADVSNITASAWGTGGLRTVAQIEELVRDLTDRLTLYSEQLPELARWHTELVVLSVDEDLVKPRWSTVENMDRSLSTLRDELAALRSFVDGVPELVSGERALILDVVEKEIDAALLDIDRQRAMTLLAITEERQAILGEAERLRAQVTRDVERIRIDATTDIQSGVDRQVERLMAETDSLITKIFWRALVLIAVTLVGLALVLRLARPRPAAS